MKRACMLALLIVMTGLLHGAAPSDRRPKPLAGVYAITNINIDPPPGASTDSHLVVKLQGEPAKNLFDAMKTEVRTDACAGPNTQTKRIGGMECYHDPQRQ